MISLTSKAAFITGGTSGIGLATANVFVAHGARVAVTGRDKTRLDTARDAIGGECLAFLADSADDSAMADGLSTAARAFGGLDIVFANAGRYVHAPLGDTPTPGD